MVESNTCTGNVVFCPIDQLSLDVGAADGIRCWYSSHLSFFDFEAGGRPSDLASRPMQGTIEKTHSLVGLAFYTT